MRHDFPGMLQKTLFTWWCNFVNLWKKIWITLNKVLDNEVVAVSSSFLKLKTICRWINFCEIYSSSSYPTYSKNRACNRVNRDYCVKKNEGLSIVATFCRLFYQHNNTLLDIQSAKKRNIRPGLYIRSIYSCPPPTSRGIYTASEWPCVQINGIINSTIP